MANFEDAPKGLVELIYLGLDHGIKSIEDGGMLIPFVLIEDNGERKIERFITERIEEGVVKAMEYVKNLNPVPESVVVVHDGFLSKGDEKYDAIFAIGFDKNQDEGYVLAQRYKPKTSDKPLEILGNVVYLGGEPNPAKTEK